MIEKRLVLVEEIRIERRRESEAVTVPVALRRQRVDVERLPEDEPSDPQVPPPIRNHTEERTDMNDTRTHEVTAFYDDRAQAQQAIDRLNAANIPAEDVRIVEGNDPAAAGGARPAEDKGFFDKLGDFFMPEEDRHTYAEGLNRGGYVVSARVTQEHHERVADILDDDHSVDLDSRSNEWRNDGWAGYQAETSARTGGRHRRDDRGRRGAAQGRQARRQPWPRQGALLRRRGSGVRGRHASQGGGRRRAATGSIASSTTPTRRSGIVPSRSRKPPKRRSSPRRRGWSRRSTSPSTSRPRRKP